MGEAVVISDCGGAGYWVSSSGNVTDEVWKQYIEDTQKSRMITSRSY
jgi:hypothetical protein